MSEEIATRVVQEAHRNGVIVMSINASENTATSGFILVVIESREPLGKIRLNRYLPYQHINKNGVNLLEQFQFEEEDGIAYEFIKEKFGSDIVAGLHSMRHQSIEKIDEVLGMDNEEVDVVYYNVVQYENGTECLRFPFS